MTTTDKIMSRESPTKYWVRCYLSDPATNRIADESKCVFECPANDFLLRVTPGLWERLPDALDTKAQEIEELNANPSIWAMDIHKRIYGEKS